MLDGFLDLLEPDEDMEEMEDSLYDPAGQDGAYGDAAAGDVTAQEIDVNGDGIMDGTLYVQNQDLDGDGIFETTIAEQEVDLNQDGMIDTIQTEILSDTDGDGAADYYSLTAEQDTDGDGYSDYMSISEDYGADGVFDAVTEYVDADRDGLWDPAGSAEGGMPGVYDYNYDPAASDPGSVIGDPEEAMDSWHPQESNDTCAVASQEFVLETLTGQEFTEQELRDLAEENGWYSPGGGTDAYATGNILEAMGLRVEKGEGNSIQDIEECLVNGGEVIVGVDSSELWVEPDGEMFGPGMQADHAIQVIGIDYSNPDQPMVIINDSGVGDGAGAMVPMDQFMDAWEDSNCFMVEAYAQ